MVVDILWDMETQDPDDFLTLLFLLGHPQVHLHAVSITPGTPAQVGLVRRALAWFGVSLPVGSYNIQHPKDCVSDWHYKVYGKIPASTDAESALELYQHFAGRGLTLLTGAPLKNLGAFLRSIASSETETGNQEPGNLVAEPSALFARWFAQGGFAGAGVVPPDLQLPAFLGRRTCPTFNFNGDPKSALLALSHPQLPDRRLISKNVCHRVYYDQTLHERFAAQKDRHLASSLIWRGMDYYLQQHPEGKKFHDPLAACCAIDDSIGVWQTVSIFRERGEWGAQLDPDSDTKIIIDYDQQRFIHILTQID